MLLDTISKYISGVYKGFWFKFMGPEHILPSLGITRKEYQEVKSVRILRIGSWEQMLYGFLEFRKASGFFLTKYNRENLSPENTGICVMESFL